jgi:hypothetical protein
MSFTITSRLDVLLSLTAFWFPRLVFFAALGQLFQLLRMVNYLVRG